jgi:hypothetical protein
VGRTSTVVEAVGEDLTVVSEAVAWTRRQWRLCGIEAVAWTRRRWRWRGIEAHAEEERARDVNLAAVKEADGDSPAWTQRRSRRRLARTQKLLWHGGVRGADGRVGGDQNEEE